MSSPVCCQGRYPRSAHLGPHWRQSVLHPSFQRGAWGYVSNECLSWRGWRLYEHVPAAHPSLCSGHKASAEGIMRHVDLMHSLLPRSVPPYREKRSICLCCWKPAVKDVEINQECRELRSSRSPNWCPSFVQSVSIDSGAYCTSAPARLPWEAHGQLWSSVDSSTKQWQL